MIANIWQVTLKQPFQEGGLSKNTVIDVIVFASVVGSSEVRLMSGELGILFAALSPDSIE